MFDDLDICKSVSWSSNHHLAAMIWIRIPKKDTKHEASHGMTGFNFQQAFQHLQVILIIFISFQSVSPFENSPNAAPAGLESRVGQSYRHDAEAWPKIGSGGLSGGRRHRQQMSPIWGYHGGNDGKWWENGQFESISHGILRILLVFLRWLAKPQGAGLFESRLTEGMV